MKYAPSALGIGQLSGSSGGTTASHNRYGSYLRARVIPVNPRTPSQTLRRETLAGLSALWRTLTDGQRQSWDALALQITKSDSLGVTYNPTGLQTYVGNNALRIFAGVATVDSPPTLDAPPLLTSITPAFGSTLGVPPLASATVAFAPTPLGTGQRIAIYATGKISAGRSFIKPSEYRLIQISAAAAASPVDIETAFVDVFGDDFEQGDKVAVKVVPISANFFRGTPIEATTTVT